MTAALSSNTQAILLLTAPLIAGRGAPSAALLTPAEYKRLARHLRQIQRQPADLVSPDASALIQECHTTVDGARLQRLLERGFLLSQALERWQARAIWVVSRADAAYPRRYKARLREDAPAVLYGCGNAGLLETGGLAVVGSRDVDASLIDYTAAVGRAVAAAGRTLVSGGARGVDQAAMRGAAEAGGVVCGVLADGLEKAAMNRENRDLLLDGRLVLASPYDPSAGFNVGNAMQRNKLIYALADAALVVSSDVGKGGTWAGATEQLDKLRFVPVFVRMAGSASAGLDALRAKGAAPWPEPADAAALNAAAAPTSPAGQTDLPLFAAAAPPVPGADGDPVADVATAAEGASEALHDSAQTPTSAQATVGAVADLPVDASMATTVPSVPEPASTPADALFETVRSLILALLAENGPMRDGDVSSALDVSPAQAREWLRRMQQDDVLEAHGRPARYTVALQPSLPYRRSAVEPKRPGKPPRS